MNSISTRFVISNIISSILLIGSIPLLKEQNTELLLGDDKIFAAIVFLILVIGQFASIYKAKVIASNYFIPSFKRFEKIFLSIIFFFGLTSIMLSMMIFTRIFGKTEDVPTIIMVVSILWTITAVVLLVVEAMIVFGSISVKAKEESSKVNIMMYLYVSIGIAVGWDTMLIGSKIGLSIEAPNFVSELIAAIVLAFMLLLPFQRLFWFEIMAESKSWKDNLKVIGSVIMVLTCAIIPLFFK